MNISEIMARLSPFTSYEESTRRMETCEECPEIKAGMICGVCHCALPAKVRMLHSSCPQGKW